MQLLDLCLRWSAYPITFLHTKEHPRTLDTIRMGSKATGWTSTECKWQTSMPINTASKVQVFCCWGGGGARRGNKQKNSKRDSAYLFAFQGFSSSILLHFSSFHSSKDIDKVSFWNRGYQFSPFSFTPPCLLCLLFNITLMLPDCIKQLDHSPGD